MTTKLSILAILAVFGTAFFGFLSQSNDEMTALSATNIETATRTSVKGNPIELGKVAWIRDLDEGIAEAKKTDKPLLILFQEVPGCANCTKYGRVTMSHPLIVEAIESYFTPICIYNNKKGKDGEALAKFNEPSWNNPVIRILENDTQKDIVNRMPNFRSIYEVIDGMRTAMDKKDIAYGKWFELLHAEQKALELSAETATFTMYCFWSGEGFFGSQPGVIATAPGFQDGKEVVQVTFDKTLTSKEILSKKAASKKISNCASNKGFRIDREPKYYLAQTHYRAVPMTEIQAAKANSLIGKKGNPNDVLSPRQIEIATHFSIKNKEKWPNYIKTDDLVKVWEQVAMNNE